MLRWQTCALSHPTPSATPTLVFLHQLAKQASIVGTVVALESMTHIPLILYASMGLPESFRYALLVRLALLFAGVSIQLAIFTVLLKWVLAGLL